VRLEHRHSLLCHGTLTSATDLPYGQSPTFWWPDDRSWCVRTDVDAFTTYIGASRQCIDALIELAELEAIEVRLDDAFVQ
jgi:hypothetical protein